METSRILEQELKESEYGYISLSHGTLRNQDLLPVFLDALAHYGNGIQESEQHFNNIIKDIPQEAFDNDQHPYWDTEDCDYDMEAVRVELELLVPEGYYFGTLEGDGSDFGFWPIMEEGEDF